MIMKKSFLLIVFSAISLMTFAQLKRNIEFRLEGGKADSILIGYSSESNKSMKEVIDTVVMENGVLKYDMKFTGFINASIIPFSLIEKYPSGVIIPRTTINFYMNEGDNMVILAKLKGWGLEYTITGNAISQDIALFHNEKLFTDSTNLIRNRIYHQKKASEHSKKENDIYMASRIKGNVIRYSENLNFVRKHLDSEYSPRLLLGTSYQDSVVQVFSLLTKKSKDSFFGKILAAQVNGWFAVKVGKKLPNFIASTIDGKQFNLSEQKSKFILLDFWGSWCGPCLAEAPQLRAFNEKYKDRVTLIGVIADDSREQAKTAIKKHKLDWTHLYSEANEFGDRFGVSSFPFKILLNDKGVIIKIISGTSDKVFEELTAAVETD